MTAFPSAIFDRVRRHQAALHIALLAALAYLPALTAAPGRMPSDTKLYLYFNPWRLTTDAPFAWDSRQFAGWVPHQTVSYLWPSGPWYSLFEFLGVPDWVAQRLWIATLMFVAGLGARWAARHLGIGAVGALVAALFYQLSPYLLPYVSRTSAMLLPWAGLGWLIGLTIRAATRTRWRDVAIFGLVIATVAAPNATAILMIAPAPVLWLVHAGWARLVTWRHAVVTALKIGAASLVASLWWMAMLSVQGRFGADVLGYSESLEAVSLTSSSPEVLRAMGYWLFYIRDPIGFATSAAYDYMSSGRLIAISFSVLVIGLAGLAVTRWISRRFAVMLLFTGVVLAVGVHPIDDPAPLMAPFAENSRSSIALALRSSTRAMPLSSLGVALGAGALITALSRTRWRVRSVTPWIAGSLAVLNLPVLFNGGLVDPNLERDQDPPAAWGDAASALDDSSLDARVIQLPGTEFGAFRWGYTVDPPLPGLSDKPLVTRDLLPLGSPAAMDLIYAIDDRFQEGWAELAAVAPVARLLGADTIWLPNDIAFERFRTPRPELVVQQFAGGDAGFGNVETFGDAQQNLPVIPMIDEQSISSAVVGTALPPVQLVSIAEPEAAVRVKTDGDTVVVAGSADGLVDAAAAGLISGHELIRYTAELVASGHEAVIGQSDRVIVTDSNRDRAHQWRSAQDVWGYTEDGLPGAGVLRFDSADQRTPVFPDATSDDMTIAAQRGDLTAEVSAYGEPFAYRPESRAAMAIDGDLSTAWVVGDRFDADGEFITLTAADPISEFTLVQPQDLRNRWISRVTVSDDAGSYDVELTDESRTDRGQRVVLSGPSDSVTITIAETASGDGVTAAEGFDAVGFAEIRTNLGSSEEVVRVPSNVLPEVQGDQALDIVLTRLRVRATNRWRGDPEPVLTRSFTLASERTFTPLVTARIDQRASDLVLAELIGWDGTTANRRLSGVPAMGGWAATDGVPGTAWTTPFGLAVGSQLTVPMTGQTTLSSLQLTQPDSEQLGTITEVSVVLGDEERIVGVPAPDANGVSNLSFDPITGDTLILTITATDGATTTDRRYANTVELPVAVSELSGDGIAASPLPAMLTTECRSDLVTVDRDAVSMRFTGPIQELFAGGPGTIERCTDGPLSLGAGEHIVRSAPGLDTGIDIDRIVLSSEAGDATGARLDDPSTGPDPTVTVTDGDRTSRTFEVDDCPTGCWLVFGEGYNDGWAASVDGESLGPPTLVDGGFNGWRLPPSATSRRVQLTFDGQATLTIGLVLSALAVLACIVVIVIDRRKRDLADPDPPKLADTWRGPPFRVTATAAIAGLLVISPVWGLLCGAVAALCSFALRRPRAVAVVAVGIAVVIGVIVTWRVVRDRPFANAAWPAEFEDLHRLGMAIVVFLLAGVTVPDTTSEH